MRVRRQASAIGREVREKGPALTALLQEKGKPAGDMDVLIAATALVAGEKLVTDNEVHFRHITGLIVDTY